MSDLAASCDIERIAENILRDSKSLGVFPTPVQAIVDYTELKLDEGVDLSDMPESFLKRYGHSIREKVQLAFSRILGAIDLREKTIYLDLSQKVQRRRFVQLHETGHHALPWQQEVFCVDDEATFLDPDVKEEFEQEASYFASTVLFQRNVFDHEAEKLPLGMKSAMVLSDKFGASKHAAIRRYVERSPKRCALLVLDEPSSNGGFAAPVRDYFQSRSFSTEFGQITWPATLDLEYPFVQELKIGRKYHENGFLNTTSASLDLVALNYHFFHNSFNTFVFLFPAGERIRSRVKIVTR